MKTRGSTEGSGGFGIRNSEYTRKGVENLDPMDLVLINQRRDRPDIVYAPDFWLWREWWRHLLMLHKSE